MLTKQEKYINFILQQLKYFVTHEIWKLIQIVFDKTGQA